MVTVACYSHKTGVAILLVVARVQIVELAEHYCKHSGHVVLLYICRYKDYKLKNVQTCHFLDSLPATGTSQSSFSSCNTVWLVKK